MKKNKNYHLLTKSLTVILFSAISWVSNAQTSGPYSYFESFRAPAAKSTMIAEGWTFSNSGVTPGTSSTVSRTGIYLLTLGNIVGYNAITPAMNNPNVFKFYYRSSSATNNVTFKVDWSANNFATAALGSVTGNTTSGATYQSFSINASNFGTYTALKFRITITSTIASAALVLDDMSCTSTVGSENKLILPELGSLTSYQTVPVSGGNAPSTPSTYKFYDQGGQYDNYNKNQSQTNYFAPTNAWDKVKITFNSFNAEASTNISVYNWDGVTVTPLLVNFVGTNANNLPSPVSYTTLHPGDSLKVVYVSGTTQSSSQNIGYDCTVESISYLSISGLSSTSGCVGMPLTINGTSLSNATAVTINGIGATINSNSATQIVVTPVAGSVGTGVVSVTTPLGTITSTATISINSTVIPNFNPVAPIFLGDILNELPTTSLVGITGSWSPAMNNTVTTTYTFTPSLGQCATVATMTIEVYQIPNPAAFPLSPGGKLDVVFDRFGNKYSLEDVKTTPKPNVTNKAQMLNSTVLCSSGIFDLYFEVGSGMEGNTSAEIERRNVVCQVFSDLSNFINSPLHNAGNTNKVKIWVRDITQIPNVNPATLGLATGFYNVPSSPNAIIGGIVDNEVWKTIHAGVDSYINVSNPIISNSGVSVTAGLFYHGMMAINTNYSWNTDLSLNASSTQNDLYTVVLHEVTHALGFASLIDFDGNSKIGAAYRYYSRYDTFLNYNATSLINPASTACSMYDYIFTGNPTILHPGCGLTPPVNTAVPLDHTDCTATTVNYVGSVTVPVYNSSCFETSSSLSHFEDECYTNPAGVNYGNNNYFVMSNANAPGATKRFLKPEERATLCDIGYNLNTQFGGTNNVQNNFINYGGTNCLGNSVAGINDGINGTNFLFIGTHDIAITGILNNDYSYTYDSNNVAVNNVNNLVFECLQDVYDTSATISSTGNDINATITFNSLVSGVHLLRYIPFDTVTGQRGNITYIYVFVRAVINSCGIPSTCDLVMNGDFEQNSGIPQNSSRFDLVCGWKTGFSANTPDYFYRNTNFSWVNIPCNFIGSQEATTSIISNNGYGGLFINGIGGSNISSETIVNQLNTPLLTNTKYQLQLDLSLAKESTSVKKVQIYFSNNEDLQIANGGTIPVILPGDPMLFETNDFINNQTDWTHVIFNFTTDNSAGQNFMYIGGLSNVSSQTLTPILFTPCVGTFNYNTQNNLSYYYIDNVSLVPIGDANLNLPATLCASNIIPDLSSYVVSAPTTGVFSGDGVTASGTAPNIVYAFNPSNLSAGNHTISYTYAPSPGCPTITITDTINVTLCPQFDPIAPLCQGAVAGLLPDHPINIPTLTGTWSPATIDTTTVGTFTYTFTPTTGQSITATATVTVTILPAPSAGTISGATTIYGTGTTTLTPTVSGGTWSSNDTSIATVDNNGIVTGVTAGTTTLVYTVTGSNGCTATVTTSITVQSINSSCTDATVWNGTSWSNGVPNTPAYLNTAVVFTANFDTTEDLYACTVLVTNGATANVKHIGSYTTSNQANTFTVTNEVVVSTGSLFFFDDDSSLVQINDVANTGNIKYLRTTPDVNKFDYTYWSSPVAGQSLFNLSPTTLWDKFYKWNPLIYNWEYTSPYTTFMNAGQGFIIRGPQEYDFFMARFNGYFTGVPHNGLITTPVYNAASSWNLIGNPYPSGLNIDCFLSDSSNTHLGGTVYLWSHDIPIDWTGTTQQGFPGSATYNYNVFSYTAYNRMGNVATAITPSPNGTFATNRPIGTVAAGQSFFIESSATGVATFTNSMRVGSQNQENSQFFKTQTQTPLVASCNTEERHRVWLYIRNLTPAQQFKETLVGYSPNATTSSVLDRDYDAKTFIADLNAINLYSLSPGNDQLAIQGRYLNNPFDTSDFVPLGFSCKLNPAASSNTLEIGSTDFDGLFASTNFYLRITQPDGSYGYHDLKLSPYQFTIAADVLNNTTRFALVFEVPVGGVILKTALPIATFKVTLSPNPFDKSFSLQLQSPLKDDVTVIIFDVLGKQLSSETISVENLKNTIFATSLASGVYQAEIIQGTYKESIKIIKK